MARRSKSLEKRSSGRSIKTRKGTRLTHPIKDPNDRNKLIRWFDKRYDDAKSDIKKAQADRDRMIVLVALNTGFRAEDILQLLVREIEKGYIDIKENKTGKHQSFFLDSAFMDEVKAYIERNELKPNDYMFKGQQQQSKGKKYLDPITRQRINQVINVAVDEIGIPFSVGMHGLRKTFGYYCISVKGINPLTVMKLYNHTNWFVTSRYIEWGNDDLEMARSNLFISDTGVTKKRRK